MGRFANLVREYEARKGLLDQLAVALEDGLRECVGELSRIDRIAVRVKDPDSFARKASRYEVPLEEIEDQVAGRILVHFVSDIDQVSDRLCERFSVLEGVRHEPERDAEFGYESHHHVFLIPDHLKPDGWEAFDPMPTTFEVQIRTLFMHAYAEPQHDFAYKGGELPREIQRQLAWIAASAWGADRAYEQVLAHFSGEETAGS